jgi:hypothetical protein
MFVKFFRTTKQKNGQTEGADSNIHNSKKTINNFVTRTTNALSRNSFTIRQSHSKAEFTIKKQMVTNLLLSVANELLSLGNVVL